ncbi:MAG TPA: histidine kinase [Thermoanaerobaculia bacterium]|nr:histidine kinase [Thermoanaerobaculia bacterium]
MAPSPWRARGWLYALAWLPIATIYLTLFVVNGMPLGLAVRAAVINVLPNALLGVAVLRVPRRLPLPEGRRARFLTTHVAVLVGFLLASSAGWMALALLEGALFHGSSNVRFEFLRLLPWRVLIDLLVYCSLLGLGYAWHNAARAARAEALRARAELEALRSQLNPHFILNTFHALVGLVRRDPAVAEEALERLGDLLRYSLRIQREGRDEVTLQDEWAFVQSYIDLERLRLEDRLRVTFDAASETLDCVVPSFALQTLVENSIHHAIAPRAAGGRLAVSARQVEDRLIVRVEDDGPGGAAPPDGNHGVGLRLLRERLAALYGMRARLDLETAPDGVAAVLDLPARHLQEDE